jgi:hypothetical protein
LYHCQTVILPSSRSRLRSLHHAYLLSCYLSPAAREAVDAIRIANVRRPVRAVLTGQLGCRTHGSCSCLDDLVSSFRSTGAHPTSERANTTGMPRGCAHLNVWWAPILHDGNGADQTAVAPLHRDHTSQPQRCRPPDASRIQLRVRRNLSL